MRRNRSLKLLRSLVAALVALASSAPQVTYAHSHPVASGRHHDHVGRDAPAHDDHDDDDGPSLSEGIAHVHGSWFGFAVTFPSPGGASSFDDSDSLAACPTLSADLDQGLSGPLKERVPWPEVFDPPAPPLLGLLAAHPSESPLLGDRASHALAGSTLVLRC